MKSTLFLAASATVLLVSGCGYKGDLYLPKEGDKARFGVIQTGLPIHAPARPPEQNQTEEQP